MIRSQFPRSVSEQGNMQKKAVSKGWCKESSKLLQLTTLVCLLPDQKPKTRFSDDQAQNKRRVMSAMSEAGKTKYYALTYNFLTVLHS